MNRIMAAVLLVLMVFALLFSMYSFYRGRFTEGLFIYPLLIAIYVFMKLSDRGRK